MIIDELNKKIADIENLANDKTSTIESKVSDLTDGLLMVADAVDIIPEMVDEKITAITKEFSTIKDSVSKVKAQKGEKGAKGDKGDSIKGDKGDNGKDGSPDTGEQIVDKLNELEGVLDTKVLKDFTMPDVKDLERQINTIGNQTLRLLSRPTTTGGVSGSGVSSLNSLTGAVTLSAGNNVTLNESGNDIEITANFTQEGKYMISGGITWSGTGLTYDVSFLNYFFNGNKTANPTQVTLDASDPTDNRFDAIVVDEAGTVTTITGTPSANPEVPAIPEDQLQVTIILVAAGSTTPTIASEEIYMDDPTTGWTFSTYQTATPTGSINFAGTSSPKQGTECIEASTDARLGARFVRGTSFDAFQYTMLQVWVRFTGTAVATNKSLNVRFENSAGTLVANTVNLFNYGLQRGVLNTWQLVVVPITAFGALPATVKGLKMIMAGGTVGAVRQWDIDYMILTNGSVPYANVPTIAFYKDDVGIASQSGINLIEGTGVTIDAVNNPLYNRVDYTLNAAGGSPAGSDTQIQYNNAGSFGASSDFIFDQATSTFTTTNNWEVSRTTINFDSGGGNNDLTASTATAFTGTPPTTFAVLAFGNIQIVNYINLTGGNFGQGNTITGSVSGAEGHVAYDDGVGQLYVSITNSIQFAATDVIDNANGVTADYDTSTTSDDIFFWYSTNGGSGGPIVITGTAQTLNDGIDITFGSTTGHGAEDSWVWSYKTLKNTVLSNRKIGSGIFGGAINGSYFKSGSGSSTIQAINGFFQNGDDDRIFPLSAYEDLTSGNNADKERAYYGFNPFKGDPTNPLEFVVKTQKGIGAGPGTTEISTLTVGTLSGFAFISDKSFQVSTPLFVTQGSLFSWTGDINGNGITIDDTNSTATLGNQSGGNNTKITIDDVNEHITISNLPAYDDDTAAGVGGLTAGMIYMTTGSGSAPLNAAGILMIKQ